MPEGLTPTELYGSMLARRIYKHKELEKEDSKLLERYSAMLSRAISKISKKKELTKEDSKLLEKYEKIKQKQGLSVLNKEEIRKNIKDKIDSTYARLTASMGGEEKKKFKEESMQIKKRHYQKRYYQLPGVRESRRAYYKQPEQAEKNRKHAREYYYRLGVKEKRQKQREKKEFRDKMREYMRNYMREYYKRPDGAEKVKEASRRFYVKARESFTKYQEELFQQEQREIDFQPEKSAEIKERKQVVANVLKKNLNDLELAVITRWYYDGQEISVIAQELNKTEAEIEEIHQQALVKLRETNRETNILREI